MVGGESLRDRLSMRALVAALSTPKMDRIIAFIAIVPFAYSLAHEIRVFGFNFAWIVANTNFLILIVTMLLRHPPERVTPNPLYWLLAFVASYWFFLVGSFTTQGTECAPHGVIVAVSVASFGISLWARLSLGRSIGLVPAQRKLIMHGAYRFMRHPMYTAIFLSYLALGLQNFSAVNVLIFGTGAGLFVIKSVVEENFLRQDPEYDRYMARVRWRWIPFVA